MSNIIDQKILASLCACLSGSALICLSADAQNYSSSINPNLLPLSPLTKTFDSQDFLLAQSQTKRVALVIGNSEYKNGSNLRNPVNDANDMAKVLQDLDFEVILLTNANLKSMDQGLEKFYRQLQKGAIGLFYYAGHGVQVNGENYLIPVDADLARESEVNYEAVPLGKLIGAIQDVENDVSIIILDACRDNPFARSWTRSSSSRGLAPIQNSATGSFIAYATGPGNTAQDGTGRNGTFTEALLKHLKNENQNIEEIFKRVRVDVAKKTNNEQVPWTTSSLIGDFYFTQLGNNNSVTNIANDNTTNNTTVSNNRPIETRTNNQSTNNQKPPIETQSSNSSNQLPSNNNTTVAVNSSNFTPKAFTGSAPQLVEFRTPHNKTSYPSPTYYLTIKIPPNSLPLGKVSIAQTRNIESIDFYLNKTEAFVIDSNQKKVAIPIKVTGSMPENVEIFFDTPIVANNTVTISFKAKPHPSFDGIFQFKIAVFPEGSNTRGFNLGIARIHLYKSF
jgi:hypothetical protein